MGRTLRYAGTVILAVSVVVLLLESLGLVPEATGDRWVLGGAAVGAGLLAAGLLLALFSPVARAIRRGHCVRCGARTERGQTYCRDHLQQTLNEIRDRTREGFLRNSGGRA
jgi:hypothetical protein